MALRTPILASLARAALWLALALASLGRVSAQDAAGPAPAPEPLVYRHLWVGFEGGAPEVRVVDAIESDPFVTGPVGGRHVREGRRPLPWRRWPALVDGRGPRGAGVGAAFGFTAAREASVVCAIQGQARRVAGGIDVQSLTVRREREGSWFQSSGTSGEIPLGILQGGGSGGNRASYTTEFSVLVRAGARARLGPVDAPESWRRVALQELERFVEGGSTAGVEPALQLLILVPAGEEGRTLLRRVLAETEDLEPRRWMSSFYGPTTLAARARAALLRADDPAGCQGDWSLGSGAGAVCGWLDPGGPEPDEVAGFARLLAGSTRSREVFVGALELLGGEGVRGAPEVRVRLDRAAALGLGAVPPAVAPLARPIAAPGALAALAALYLVLVSLLAWGGRRARAAETFAGRVRAGTWALLIGLWLVVLDVPLRGIDLLPDLLGFGWLALGFVALRRADLDGRPLLTAWATAALFGAASATVLAEQVLPAANWTHEARGALLAVAGVGLSLGLRRFFAAAGELTRSHFCLLVGGLGVVAGLGVFAPRSALQAAALPEPFGRAALAGSVLVIAGLPLLWSVLLGSLRADAVDRHRAREARLAAPRRPAGDDDPAPSPEGA